MNVAEYMSKHDITDADLDRIAEPYERGGYKNEGGKIYGGSHVNAVGKRRVTVTYDAGAAQCVEALAHGQR